MVKGYVCTPGLIPEVRGVQNAASQHVSQRTSGPVPLRGREERRQKCHLQDQAAAWGTRDFDHLSKRWPPGSWLPKPWEGGTTMLFWFLIAKQEVRHSHFFYFLRHQKSCRGTRRAPCTTRRSAIKALAPQRRPSLLPAQTLTADLTLLECLKTTDLSVRIAWLYLLQLHCTLHLKSFRWHPGNVLPSH